MSGYGSSSKAAFRRLALACCLRSGSGPFQTRNRGIAESLLAWLCSRLSTCPSTNRPPSFLARCGRAILLVTVLGFVTQLSLAEWYYAQGFPPTSIEDGMRHMAIARKAYPFLPRFREAMGRRLEIYARRGE